MNDDTPDYVTVESAGKRTGVSARTLRYWIRSGKLPAMTGKRGKLVRLDDVRRVAALAGRDVGNDDEPAGIANASADGSAGNVAVTTPASQALEQIRDQWIVPLTTRIEELSRDLGKAETERDQAARERDELRARLAALEAEAATRQPLPATAEPPAPEPTPARKWWRWWR